MLINKNYNDMYDLFKQMDENRKEVINLALEKNQLNISFDNVDEYDLPCVLYRDKYDNPVDLCITKARIIQKEDGKFLIHFFSNDIEDWIDEDDALSLTANDVYMTMYKCLIE